jgi:predicted P-loop ATPase
MLILISKQKGWNKTRFLETVAESNLSKNYVSVYELNAGDVELCKLIRGKAVVNIDECDAAMRGKCAAKTKAFLTTRIDNFRPSYGAIPVSQPRVGAVFGTSNNIDIIQDLDGDRRFYPVLLEKPIDIDWFEENRTLIYGYYKGLLESGAKTFPTTEEQLDLTQAIQPQFKVQPLYFERLAEFLSYCKDKNYAFSTTDLLHASISILDNQPKYEKANVESLLKAESWQLTKSALSSGTYPGAAKWSSAPLATLLTRVDLKRQFEAWDQTH